ncbi:MAG: hypothetical protein KC466_19445 [Myxococcales bacterium]|nr:hypothetical protein [Myxococcales bacterium]
MDLRHDFERAGHRLRRWGSVPPFALAPLVLIALGDYTYPGGDRRLDAPWEGFCLAVGFFGFGIRAFTVGCRPKHTSGRNTHSQRAARLNTTGMYSIVRHPLYLGNFFMGLGVALFPHQLFFTLVYVLAFWLYYERIMYAEEALSRAEFGDAFELWARVTPAFIPRPRNWTHAAPPFSLKSVSRREYSGFLNLIVFLFAFEFAGDWVVTGRPELDPAWAALVALAVVAWFTLRTLKKRTDFLDVSGR